MTTIHTAADPRIDANSSLLKERPKQHPPTAHFPGGGPPGSRCSDCEWYCETSSSHRRKRGRCMLWAEQRGMGHRFGAEFQLLNPHDWWGPLHTIPAYTAGCKYYWEKQI